jgi:hypothetical protein
MKRLVTFGCLIALLGGCAVVPVGYPVYERPHREYHGGYYADGWHGHGYGWRNQGYYRR